MKRMRALWSVAGVILAAGVVLATEPPAEDKLKEQKTLTKELVEAFAKEDFPAVRKDFDDTMKKLLSVDKLETTWKQVVRNAGPFKKITGYRAESAGKFDYVFAICQFEKTELEVKAVFTADKQVTGLFFQESKKTYDFKPPSYAKKDSFHETDVTVGSGEWLLPGNLTLPTGDGPFPAVILVQGSGPNDRDETLGPNKPFRDLAWGLATRGIAVLRYEKRTREYGPKVAALKELTIKEEVVDDVLEAAALLRKEKQIDAKKIYVLGHSLGATVAPRIAELDDRIAGLILLAGTSRPLEDVVLEQVQYIYSLLGSPTDERKEDLEKLKKQVERVKDPQLPPDTPAIELPLGVPATYWLALRAYDCKATAAKVKKPMLILQGERDYQATMEDFNGWNMAVGSRKDVKMKSYPKLNHLFMEGEGKAKPQEYEKPGYVAEEVVNDIAEWVKKQ